MKKELGFGDEVIKSLRQFLNSVERRGSGFAIEWTIGNSKIRLEAPSIEDLVSLRRAVSNDKSTMA